MENVIWVFTASPDVNGLGAPRRCCSAAAEHTPASGEMALGCAGLAGLGRCCSLGLTDAFQTNAVMHSLLQRLHH